jgi:hypothetical protein
MDRKPAAKKMKVDQRDVAVVVDPVAAMPEHCHLTRW